MQNYISMQIHMKIKYLKSVNSIKYVCKKLFDTTVLKVTSAKNHMNENNQYQMGRHTSSNKAV